MSLGIVFVAPFGLKHKTTVWARTLPIAQELVANGHTATILVPPWDSPEDAGKVETLKGVRVEQVSLKGGLVGTVRRLAKAVEQAKPTIVHIVKPRAHAGLVQWSLWLRRHPSGPKILLDVDDWEQAWNAVNRYNGFVANFLSWQEIWGIGHADGITAASRWLEKTVASVSPHIPRLYLPNGVNPLLEPQNNLQYETETQARSRQAPQVLLFTRFVEASPEWIRDFWTALNSQLPTAKLVIAGTPVQPWLEAPFRTALAGLSNIQWAGFIAPSELPGYYARSTCAVYPSAITPLLQAKCSVKLATTLLHGVPVIASAVGEQANYGAEGAAQLVHADATPAEFANVVIQVIQNPAQHAALRKQATERLLTRYAWPHLTQNLIDFYISLL